MSMAVSELLRTLNKPVIAMAHLPPVPGTPMYNAEAGPQGLVNSVGKDVAVLCDAGVDAILFCNEGDRPYQLKAGPEGVAMLARVVTELAPRDRPFGVDFLWDAEAALAVAAVTGAQFIREVVTGVYESDMGVWSPSAGRLLRYRRALGCNSVSVFMNITPEFASRLGGRDVGQIARSVAVSSLPDAILVSGPMAGAEPDLETLEIVREAVPPELPVLVNTGVKSSNVAAFLEVADGVIVGSDLKVGGSTWNPVDPTRAKAFMKQVGEIRADGRAG